MLISRCQVLAKRLGRLVSLDRPSVYNGLSRPTRFRVQPRIGPIALSRFFNGQRDAVRRTNLITVARALWRLSQITVDDDIVDDAARARRRLNATAGGDRDSPVRWITTAAHPSREGRRSSNASATLPVAVASD